MQEQTLLDGTDAFKVSLSNTESSSTVVLFAVGAGGNPERHVTLLESMAKSGSTVVAPHFERIVSPMPTEDELMLRARRLSIALNTFSHPGATIVGVGHSIGAAMLIAQAGGHMWLGPSRRVNVVEDERLSRLVLLAPPTGFFQAPGALDAVRIPILAWVGSKDNITPPSHIEWLAQEIHDPHSVDIRVTDGAGHFSFMDQIPPHATEPLNDKQSFLLEHSNDICKFLFE